MERPYNTLKPIRVNGWVFIYKLIGCQLSLNLVAVTSGFSLLVVGGGGGGGEWGGSSQLSKISSSFHLEKFHQYTCRLELAHNLN